MVKVIDLPKILLRCKEYLPPISAIYIVVDTKTVLYVGRTTNLRQRWKNHHRYSQIITKHPNAEIYFQYVKEEELEKRELLAIQNLNPIYNKTFVYEKNENGDVLVRIKGSYADYIKKLAEQLNVSSLEALDHIIEIYGTYGTIKRQTKYKNLPKSLNK